MKQNGVVCEPGPALLFFIFRFEYLISGPLSYRDFRETGPRPEKGHGFYRPRLKTRCDNQLINRHYFKRVRRDSSETDDPVALYKRKLKI